VRHWLAKVLSAAVIFGAVACVSPDAQLPSASDRDVVATTLRSQEQSVARALAREERVRRLAWPLLVANADLCPKTRPSMGWRVGDANTVKGLAKGLKSQHVAALGWTDAPQILSVAPGSPAAAAGLQPGDQVVVAMGEHVEDLASLGESLGEVLEDWERGQRLAISVDRDGEIIDADIEPVETCAVRIVSSASGSINASAAFKTMTVYAGLIRALPDDNDLAFVLAHELAHMAGQHPRKVTRNSIVSGSVLWGPPALFLANGFDWLTSYPAKKLGSQSPPLTTATMRALGSTVKSVDFEREADYVGLYMHVRAGGSAEGLANVFQTFANVSPRTTWLKVTHPVVPERLLHLEQTADEIAAKLGQGDELIPEGWSIVERD